MNVQQTSINAIRILSAEAIQKANSGHPGLPIGSAPIAYTLWQNFLKFNNANPKWDNRDRFVLSAGHGSMLNYSLLYLYGFGYPDSSTGKHLDDAVPFMVLIFQKPFHKPLIHGRREFVIDIIRHIHLQRLQTDIKAKAFCIFIERMNSE